MIRASLVAPVEFRYFFILLLLGTLFPSLGSAQSKEDEAPNAADDSPDLAAVEAVLDNARSFIQMSSWVGKGAAQYAAAGKTMPPFPVNVWGNRVFPSQVIRKAIRVNEDDIPNQELADSIAKSLQSLYRDLGYELATVRAKAHDGAIDIYMAEGHLRKVVVIGGDEVRTLSVKLDLRLLANTYNTFQVAEEMKRIREKYGYKKVTAEVFSNEVTENLVDVGQVMPAFGDPEADKFLKDLRGDHELRIRLVSEKKEDSFSYGIGINPPFGLDLRTNYRNGEFLLEDDILSAHAKIAGAIDQWFTRAQGAGRYDLPRFGGDLFRPAVRAGLQLTNLGRSDLDVDSYLFFETSTAVALGLTLSEGIVLSGSIGVRFDEVLNLEVGPETPPSVKPDQRFLRTMGLGLNFQFRPVKIRTYQRHFLRLHASSYNMVDPASLLKLSVTYRKVWNFGFNDFYLHFRSFHALGDAVTWKDESTIGSVIMKVVPGEQSFSPRQIQAGTEVRAAIFQEILKVNLFAGVAAYSPSVESPEGPDNYQFATAFGPGASMLLMDVFNFDLYYAAGVNSDGETEGKVVFSLDKVF